jgi:hypothetical protein
MQRIECGDRVERPVGKGQLLCVQDPERDARQKALELRVEPKWPETRLSRPRSSMTGMQICMMTCSLG